MLQPGVGEVLVTQDIGPDLSKRWDQIRAVRRECVQLDREIRKALGAMSIAQQHKFAEILKQHGRMTEEGVTVEGPVARQLAALLPGSQAALVRRGRLYKQEQGMTLLFWVAIETQFIPTEDADLRIVKHLEGGQTTYGLVKSVEVSGAAQQGSTAFERLMEGVWDGE